MPAVLITGARAPVALDCALSFANAGFDVHLADSITPYAARLSRRRWTVHRLPPPRYRFRSFREALNELAGRLKPELVVPTCEEVFYVAAALESGSVPVFAPSLTTLRKLHSKYEFAQLSREAGVTVPETWRIQAPQDLDGLDGRDLVLKPEYSRFANATLIRPSAAEMAALHPSPDRAWVAQHFIPGEEICSWAAVHDGFVTAHVTYRPAWRHGHAAAYAFEAINCPAMEAIARRIAAATGMSGHLSFDAILSGGRVVPIECNPRAVSGLHLFDAGADMARAILGQVSIRVPAGRLRYLSPAMILLGAASALHRHKLEAFQRDWKRGADATGRNGDWPARLGSILDAACFAALGWRRGIRAQTTDDIEWNGEPIT